METLKMKHILIKDHNGENFITVTFKELLESISSFNNNYFWSLYELDASVIPPGIQGYSDLMDNIDSSELGYKMSFNDIVSLASQLNQVINIILVASDKNNTFKPFEDSNSWRNQYPICIEMIDGDYWEIYSSDENLIKFLEGKYNDTEVLIAN